MWQPPPSHPFSYQASVTVGYLCFLYVSSSSVTETLLSSQVGNLVLIVTLVTYPCRRVIVSQVSSFFSCPCQRTWYRVVLTLSSSTCLWKSSPITTICLGIHVNYPSVCCKNVFQTGSKYEPSSELEILGETWWNPWLSLIIKNFFVNDYRSLDCTWYHCWDDT